MANLVRRIDSTNTAIFDFFGGTNDGNLSGTLSFTFSDSIEGLDDATIDQMANDLLFAAEFHERKREEDIQYMLNQVDDSSKTVQELANTVKESSNTIQELAKTLETNTADLDNTSQTLDKQVTSIEELQETLKTSLEEVKTIKADLDKQKEALNEQEEALQEQSTNATEQKEEVNTLQDFINIVVGNAIVPNDNNLWKGQYRELISFIKPIEIGQTYKMGDIVKATDPNADPKRGEGTDVLIRVDTNSSKVGDTVTYQGEDLFSNEHGEIGSQKYFEACWDMGYDIRPYSRYPRKNG